MDHVAGAITRIRAIEARVRPAVPTGGFHRALAAAATSAGPADVATSAAQARSATSTARPVSAPTAVPLAQLLGRPVAPGPAVDRAAPLAAPPAATAPTAPTGPAQDRPHLPVDAPISSAFGMRTHPVTGQRKQHAGVDFAAPTGTPIEAAAPGTVTFAGVRGGYGNLVIVDHGDGTETRYAHQATLAVRTGERVGAGQALGTVGSTGLSTGPHLHFEVRRDGTAIDPVPWLERS